jgi:hypothetical protein
MALEPTGAADGAGDKIQLQRCQGYRNTKARLQSIARHTCWDQGVIRHIDANEEVVHSTTHERTQSRRVDEQWEIWEKSATRNIAGSLEHNGGTETNAATSARARTLPALCFQWKLEEYLIEAESGIPPPRYQERKEGHHDIRTYYGQWPDKPEWQPIKNKYGNDLLVTGNISQDVDRMQLCTRLGQHLKVTAMDRNTRQRREAKGWNPRAAYIHGHGRREERARAVVVRMGEMAELGGKWGGNRKPSTELISIHTTYSRPHHKIYNVGVNSDRNANEK